MDLLTKATSFNSNIESNNNFKYFKCKTTSNWNCIKLKLKWTKYYLFYAAGNDNNNGKRKYFYYQRHKIICPCRNFIIKR